jgi:hypothetical protein
MLAIDLSSFLFTFLATLPIQRAADPLSFAVHDTWRPRNKIIDVLLLSSPQKSSPKLKKIQNLNLPPMSNSFIEHAVADQSVP